MSAAEKLQRVRDLTVGAAQLALAGLRARHPGASERELLVLLARLRLGDEVVDAVYGGDGSHRGA